MTFMPVASNPSGELSADYTAPAERYVAVTPSDATTLAANFIPGTALLCRALWIGGDGNFVAIDQNDVPVTFNGAKAGTIVPIRAKRINSTNTTATGIIALY